MAKKTRMSGKAKVTKNLQAATKRWERAVMAGLYLEGSNFMGLSQRRVPVDKSALKNSGYVTLPQEVGSKIVVEIGYGGPAADYAEEQHERLDFEHPEGGQAKYLESVVDERSSKALSNVRALAKSAFAKSQGPTRGPLPTDPNSGGE